MQLEQIANGFFVNEDTKQIDVNPKDIAYGRWIIPSTLGHSEHEDVAARLVEKSREAGRWVGVSYRTFMGEIADEVEEMYARDQRQREAFEASQKSRPGFFQRLYRATMEKIGVGTPAQEPVQKPLQEAEPQPPMAFSVLASQVYLSGSAQVVANELRGMEEQGYLSVVDHGGESILMPTKKMAEVIYRKQEAQRVIRA